MAIPLKSERPTLLISEKTWNIHPMAKLTLWHMVPTALNSQNWRFWNNSWITGDQIYLLRVTPSIENINDASKYEFYGGKDEDGNPVWTKNFEEIKPLLEWNNNMGCVTITYNAPLKKYLMCVTDGGNTVSKMNTYILESDRLTATGKSLPI
jgi:hypothetical protein